MTKRKKRPGEGRPPYYKTAKELQTRIQEYFDKGIAVRKILVGGGNNKRIEYLPVPTITGLVLYCGFCDRQSFYDLERKKEFSYTIKRARTAIEKVYEELLHTGNSSAIFPLKNFGWIDKQEIEHGLSDPLLEKYKDLNAADLIEKAKELIGLGRDNGGNRETKEDQPS